MAETVNLNFILPSGEKQQVEARIGLSVLEAAHQAKSVGKANLEGACEGSLACSTCHVILMPDEFNSFPEAKEDEEDMLDLAFGLTEYSRLGCQLIITKDMEGFTFKIPTLSRNTK
jgi:2Fe-2S ferredoxin